MICSNVGILNVSAKKLLFFFFFFFRNGVFTVGNTQNKSANVVGLKMFFTASFTNNLEHKLCFFSLIH